VACPIKINVKEYQSIMESLEIQLITLDTRHRTKAHRTKKNPEAQETKKMSNICSTKKTGACDTYV
jgi:hypothetical protein